MNLKEYQTPCIKIVKVEIELPIAASNTFESNGTGGGSVNINGGSVDSGDAGSALVGGKRYFDSWDD